MRTGTVKEIVTCSTEWEKKSQDWRTLEQVVPSELVCYALSVFWKLAQVCSKYFESLNITIE